MKDIEDVKQIPSQGHGPVVLMQKEDSSLQLRDNLSRFWCACGQPAVNYIADNDPVDRFVCIKHNAEQMRLLNI